MQKEFYLKLRKTIDRYPGWAGKGSLFGGLGENHLGAKLFTQYIYEKKKANSNVLPQSIKIIFCADFLKYLEANSEETGGTSLPVITKVKEMQSRGEMTNENLLMFANIFNDLELGRKIEEFQSRYDNTLATAYEYSPAALENVEPFYPVIAQKQEGIPQKEEKKEDSKEKVVSSEQEIHFPSSYSSSASGLLLQTMPQAEKPKEPEKAQEAEKPKEPEKVVPIKEPQVGGVDTTDEGEGEDEEEGDEEGRPEGADVGGTLTGLVPETGAVAKTGEEEGEGSQEMALPGEDRQLYTGTTSPQQKIQKGKTPNRLMIPAKEDRRISPILIGLRKRTKKKVTPQQNQTPGDSQENADLRSRMAQNRPEQEETAPKKQKSGFKILATVLGASVGGTGLLAFLLQ